MDVLWFRLPRLPDDTDSASGLFGRFVRGRILVIFDRHDYWQVGFVFAKGHYQELRAQGIEAFRQMIAETEPMFARHVDHLRDWHECSLLSVESSICPRWYKPGLLLIGDAAHAMSPVGGLGISYAIMDAVAAANILGPRLKAGQVRPEDLAAVQRRRERPTRAIQAVQRAMQKRVISSVLRSQDVIRIPPAVRLFFRIPLLRDIPARVLAFGFRPERVNVPGP